MTLNLLQHRSETSVWDRTVQQTPWDTERYIAAILASACVVMGFRHRSLSGLLLAAGGGALAWWAASGIDLRRHHRGRLKAAMPASSSDGSDPVSEASEESFPASDAPSWTPMTGNTAPAGQSPETKHWH